MKMRKHEKYVRRLAALLLSAVLAAGLLSGCGKGKTEEQNKENTSVKGRYVEADIELPIQDGEKILNMVKSKDGNPVLFSQAEGGQVFRYEYKEGDWELAQLDWITQLYDGQNFHLQEIQETKEGIQVARGTDEEMLTHIARSEDGQTGAEQTIPYLSQQGDTGYPAVTNLQIDGAGNYWMSDLYQSKVVVIDASTMEVMQEINSVEGNSSEQRMLFAAENGDMAANTEEGVITIYDSEAAEKGTMKIDQQEGIMMCGDEENWHIISGEGITRMVLGNEVGEVILDGTMASMGSSLNRITGIIKGQEDDFYVLYSQPKASTWSLMHYTYDAEAMAVPENTLRVFGLSENATVEDALLGFQKTHPDVKVEFLTSGKEEGITMDDIRSLNTELLGGNGADVLLLDGLSAESYIDKGILADLTDLADGLMAQESYLESILKSTAQKDGKIYGMPVKFSVPVIYGDENTKGALSSLDSLKSYLEEHPEASIFGIAQRDYIRDFLFQMYQDEIIKEDGKVDQEKLADLLEIEVKIAANARAEVFEEDGSAQMDMGTAAKIFQQDMFSNGGSAAIINHPDSVATSKIASVTDMMTPYTLMRKMSLSPDTLEGLYIPKGIVGINKDTKQKEITEEFVKYLFSPEVQGKPVGDGLSVLESGMGILKEELASEYATGLVTMSSWKFEGEEEIVLDVSYPTEEEVDGLITICRTLKKPATQDCVIWNIYQTEADECLGGNVDAKTAAKNIAQKVDTYLAE